MSQNLKESNQKKDQEIKQLLSSNQQLIKELEALSGHSQLNKDHQENLQQMKIDSLNEEIGFLKDHYMNEIEALRNEISTMGGGNQ